MMISLNYRIGAFGFLDLESVLGKEYKSSGNNGLLDIIEALKWIKENIQFFGGDKDNITIMGESAGAKCIAALLVSPLAKGLFNRAILESGSVEAIRDKGTATKVAEKFLNNLEVDKHNKELLFSLSYEAILDAQNKISTTKGGDHLILGPVIDGEVIPFEPMEAIDKGIGCMVPLLIGTNLKESNFFLFNNEDLRDKKESCVEAIYGTNYKNVFESYNIRKKYDEDAWQNVLTDYSYKIGSYRLANTFVALGEDVFLYRFDWAGKMGPCHGQELPFVFKETGNRLGIFSLQEKDMDLANIINKYWKNFIKTGNPNDRDLIKWSKMNEENKELIVFNNKITIETLDENWDDKICKTQSFSL